MLFMKKNLRTPAILLIVLKTNKQASKKPLTARIMVPIDKNVVISCDNRLAFILNNLY